METDLATQNVIDLAIERAIDGVSAAVNDAARSVQSGRERPLPEPRRQIEDHQSEPRPALGTSRPPLISARAGAAVAASFEDLARNVASLTQAQIREMAQEMLRPMLKAWLDDNLPGVVERLVRDEIERVSRGR